MRVHRPSRVWIISIRFFAAPAEGVSAYPAKHGRHRRLRGARDFGRRVGAVWSTPQHRDRIRVNQALALETQYSDPGTGAVAPRALIAHLPRFRTLGRAKMRIVRAPLLSEQGLGL